MEYLLEGIAFNNSRQQCQSFVGKYKDIIEDVMLMKIPTIEPMFNINTIDDLIKTLIKKIDNSIVKKDLERNKLYEDIEMMVWRYYCFCKPSLKLLVLENDELKKSDKKNCLYSFERKISSHALDFINLQIKFSKLKFNDFLEYLFDNAQKYKSVSLDPFQQKPKTHTIRVYVLNKISAEYKIIYESDSFYDLIEGSKIFLHYENWNFIETQLMFSFGYNFKSSIRNFFGLKFLKIYLHKFMPLWDQENLRMGGSFYLFSMGLRASKDNDIYSYKTNSSNLLLSLDCKYDVQILETEFYRYLNPREYGIYFGFKGEFLNDDLVRREERNSKKAFADLIILNYYFNLGIKMNKNVNFDEYLKRNYKPFIAKIKKYYNK